MFRLGGIQSRSYLDLAIVQDGRSVMIAGSKATFSWFRSFKPSFVQNVLQLNTRVQFYSELA